MATGDVHSLKSMFCMACFPPGRALLEACPVKSAVLCVTDGTGLRLLLQAESQSLCIYLNTSFSDSLCVSNSGSTPDHWFARSTEKCFTRGCSNVELPPCRSARRVLSSNRGRNQRGVRNPQGVRPSRDPLRFLPGQTVIHSHSTPFQARQSRSFWENPPAATICIFAMSEMASFLSRRSKKQWLDHFGACFYRATVAALQ